MWKVLESNTPISEQQLADLATQGWELKLCVPYQNSLFWYFIQPL